MMFYETVVRPCKIFMETINEPTIVIYVTLVSNNARAIFIIKDMKIFIKKKNILFPYFIALS